MRTRHLLALILGASILLAACSSGSSSSSGTTTTTGPTSTMSIRATLTEAAKTLDGGFGPLITTASSTAAIKESKPSKSLTSQSEAAATKVQEVQSKIEAVDWPSAYDSLVSASKSEADALHTTLSKAPKQKDSTIAAWSKSVSAQSALWFATLSRLAHAYSVGPVGAS